MTDGAGKPPSSLREEAAGWFAKMRGEEADTHRAAFEQWLSRGALHRAAYNRVGEVFAAGKVLKRGREAHHRGARRNARLFAALGLAAITAGGLLLAQLATTAPFATADGAPAVGAPVGQRARTLELGQGAWALLDIDGRIAPATPSQVSVIRLAQGRARFTIPALGAEQRVRAGGVELRSRGGAFDLWLRPDGSVDTIVLAGALQIAQGRPPLRGAATRVLTVLAGEACHSDPAGLSSKVRALSGTDWPNGVLVFRDTPLPAVLDEANRYSATKLKMGDSALAGRRLTGRIIITDAKRLARQIATALAIDVDERDPAIIVLRTPR